jgi:hypothetical protein
MMGLVVTSAVFFYYTLWLLAMVRAPFEFLLKISHLSIPITPFIRIFLPDHYLFNYQFY